MKKIIGLALAIALVSMIGLHSNVDTAQTTAAGVCGSPSCWVVV